MEKTLQQYALENINKENIAIKKFKKGQIITSEGAEYKQIYLIITGKLKVCRYSVSGRDSILAYYMEKGILGDIELALNKNHYETTCIATDDCYCLAIPKNIISEELEHNIKFSRKLNEILAEKLVIRANGFSDSALKDAKARLCDYILAHSQENIFKDKLSDVPAQ